jgi:putative ABC transport system ATP-binding protein
MNAPVTGADLKVRDLVIEYSSGGYPVRPIDGLSLDAAGGDLVLLLGASGCGKTTLLSVLAAILTPTAGTVEVAGTDVIALRGASLTHYRRQTVGVVFQAFNLVPSLTALENVMVPLRGAGTRRRVARERSAALLEQVDLGHRLQHRPSGMSGGQQQRVAIARSLVSRPTVVFADEPTGNLDSTTSGDILHLLRDSADTYGQTFVMVTHEARAAAMADRVLFLADGLIVKELPRSSATEILNTMNDLGSR